MTVKERTVERISGQTVGGSERAERGSERRTRNGAERAIERARQEKRNRRDGELCARLAERRTAAEMLRTISALRGLNVRERE
ncbi:MAG: hypothetical protein ACI4NG_01935, partial [Candidatus Gallimonas sp.]